jgi:hypothetical protein
MSRRRNGFVLGMGVGLLGVVFYAAVYLPRLSPEAEAARRRTKGMADATGGPQPQRDLAPGSVWKNMTRHREYMEKLEAKAEEARASAGDKEIR